MSESDRRRTRLPTGWLSTEEAGAEVGMTSAWVRKQIEAGRLSATVFATGSRRTYRITVADWRTFTARFSRRVGGLS